MRPFFISILLTALLAALPVFAGNLVFDNGKTQWTSTQCTKPIAPPSVLGASRETVGNDMNALITQHNTYVDAAQSYMSCIKNEAENDQALVNQAIAASAQADIAQMQEDVTKSAPPIRSNAKP